MRTGLAFKDSTGVTRTIGTSGTTGNIDALEKQQKIDVQNIKNESRARKVAFANRIARPNRLIQGVTSVASLGMLPGLKLVSAANKEAKHKIIMESKIESKGESH